MKANQAELPVRSQCETLRVSTSGYYDWLGRAPSARAQANATLLQNIRDAHLASDNLGLENLMLLRRLQIFQ